MAFKTHISNTTSNQPGQVTSDQTAFVWEGVHDLARTDFKVTGTAGRAVDIAKGEANVTLASYVYGTMDQRIAAVSSDATVSSLAIAANSSGNPRIDLVCIKVDTAITPGVQGVTASSVVVVQGTASATPVAPSVPNNHLLLAQVAVANGATVISNAEITDKRKQSWVGPANLPEGYLQNGLIVRTIASNAITVALKTLSGDDPTASNPVFVKINGIINKITSALSVTLASGTNWYGMNKTATVGQSIDLFVYLDYKVSDSTIGIGLSIFGDSPTRTYGDFSATSTNQGYYGGSHTPASTDKVVNIGRVSASINASNQWSIGAVDNVQSTPTFNSRELTHVGVLTASGSMTTAGMTNTIRSWRVEGCYAVMEADIGTTTLGGTQSTQVILSTPLTPATGFTGAFISSGYVSQTNIGLLQAGTNNMFWSRSDGANFTLGAGNQFTGTIRYRAL